jgi:hypothetical protein
MNSVKWAKKIGIGIAIIGLGASSYGIYLFNMPHRDVQAQQADFSFQASQIVQEYLNNPSASNQKYLDEEGESRILQVTGNVFQIEEDFNDNKVILFQLETDKAGVSCAFTKETNKDVTAVLLRKPLTIKGVIRAGASFDADLNMYENMIMEKCSIITP